MTAHPDRLTFLQTLAALGAIPLVDLARTPSAAQASYDENGDNRVVVLETPALRIA